MISERQRGELIRDIILCIAVFGTFGFTRRANLITLYYTLCQFNRHKDLAQSDFLSFVKNLDGKRISDYSFKIDNGLLILF